MEIRSSSGLWTKSASWKRYGYDTTNQQYGVHSHFVKNTMESGSKNGSLRPIEKMDSPPRKQAKKDENPWYYSSGNDYQQKVKERLLGGKESTDVMNKDNTMVKSLDRNRVSLPALDHSKYLVAMANPGHGARRSFGFSGAAVGRDGANAPSPHATEQRISYTGPAWSFMNNQCGRFFNNMRTINNGVFVKAPEARGNSQVLTIDQTLHPAESNNTSNLPTKLDNDDAMSHSIPSNSSGSSLVSSRSSSASSNLSFKHSSKKRKSSKH